MRAHLAQAIVDASPMTSKECMRLVECSLDFDQSLSLMFLSSLSVSSVLYDARTIHAQWVESDLHFFTSYMADLCSDDSAVFGFRSSFKSMSTSLSIPNVDPLCSAECSGSRCYNGIYDCLYLFSLGNFERTILYFYHPKSAVLSISLLCAFVYSITHTILISLNLHYILCPTSS